MIARLISWSTVNRPFVLLVTLLVVGAGIYSVRLTPLDAIPDLSDVQVIIKTTFPGQAPQIVEDQVTYPLTSALLSVPGAVHVRGSSSFGESYVYIIFEDGTDTYWARSRVLEYLSQVRDQLPQGAKTQLGPDANSVGWIYQYALIDRTSRHDLAELRSLQDWFLKFELQTIPGVAEVATVGGVVKQYQVVLDPGRMRAHALSLPVIRQMILDANQEVSGSVIEMGEAEYLIRGKGYIKNLDDLRRIPYLTRREAGAALLLQDIADIHIGPQMRRGIADLDGQDEVTGGVIVMRRGGNALAIIERVKARLEELKNGLPEGVEIVETYDRSAFITRAVTTLKQRLVEEFLLVAGVCVVFLFHLRSALVIILTLPVGVLVAFIVMHEQGVNANLMSLGGIAIALGAMVDAAIVMIENVHKRLEQGPTSSAERLAIMQQAMVEVGPPLFFSLLIITLSFLPVFSLQAQEARLFTPLAYTKTYAMAAAAHYGLNVADLYDVIAMAVGGMNITYTVEGRERYPINVRYPREVRNSLTALKDLPVFLATGQQVRLADVADVAIKDGPEMTKSEDARLNGWVYIDIKGRDLGSYVAAARRAVAQHVKLPPGYSISWAGQYQYLIRANERLRYIVPLILALIFLLLYLNFRNMTEALIVMGALPLAVVGGIWLLFWLDYHFSVAVGVGFLALAGVAAEFGIVMLVYLDHAVKRLRPTTLAQLHEAVIEGAVLRVRPKAMTVAVVIAALLPIMVGGGAGSEVMRRIAAPMVGGMITAPLVSMLVIPVLYVLWKGRELTSRTDVNGKYHEKP